MCLARPELRDERPGWGRGGSATARASRGRWDRPARAASSAARGRAPRRDGGLPRWPKETHSSSSSSSPSSTRLGRRALESVPPSVEALLASRLDRLEPDERVLLERALWSAGSSPEEPRCTSDAPGRAHRPRPPTRGALARRSLIRARSRGSRGRRFFRFHHVLVRDVAYAGITKERRADLHERHGSWLGHAETSRTSSSATTPSRRTGTERAASRATRSSRGWRPGRASDLQRPGSARGSAPTRRRRSTCSAARWRSYRQRREQRAELLCELGVAQRWSGDLEVAETTFADAIAAASRDPRISLRAKVELAHAHLFRDPAHGADELLELADHAIPSSKSWATTVPWGARGATSATSAAACSAETATGSGLRKRRSFITGAPAGRQQAAWPSSRRPSFRAHSGAGCDPSLRRAARRGDGPSRAGRTSSSTRAGSRRWRGSSTRAGAIAEASSTYQEIGEVYGLANNSGRILGRLELIAGDYAAGELACARAARRSSGSTIGPASRPRQPTWRKRCTDGIEARKQRRGPSAPNRAHAPTI